MAAGLLPLCASCVHLHGVAAGKGWVCAAFVDGIPTDILSSEADHRKPFKGDGGVRYAPLVDANTVIDLLHPGTRVALARLGQDETQVAQTIAAGDIASPHKFENAWLFKLRITGTDTSYRKALDEFVYRPPEHYLNDHFLSRCNGLPVILEHPPGQMLNSEEYSTRNVGTVVLPFIEGNEVWGIARIFDDATAEYMRDNQLSTSPAVVFRPLTSENETIGLDDGKHLLVEGKPALIDHLAICEAGVWDKQGPPSGVDIGNSGTEPDGSGGTTADTAVVNKGDSQMAEEDVKEKRGDKMRDDVDKRDDRERDDADKRDDKQRDDAEGKTLDKILTHLDSMHKRMDAMCERMDAMDRSRDDAKRDDKMRDDAEEEEDRKDSGRADKKRDDEDPEHEKRQAAELEKVAKEEREEAKGDKGNRKDTKRNDAEEKEEEEDRKDMRGRKDRSRDDAEEEEEKEKKKEMALGATKDRRKDSKRDDRMRDDEDAEIEMRREEMKPAHPYPSGARGDRMRDDKNRDDSRADSQTIRDLQHAIEAANREIKSLKRTTRERTPQDRAAMADAQVRADAAYGVWGRQAPPWMAGEDETDYRIRLLREMQPHSETWKGSDLGVIAEHDAKAFETIERAVYADAVAVGKRPESVPGGALRMSIREDESGRKIREFYGSPRVWMQPWLQPVRCARRISWPPPPAQ